MIRIKRAAQLPLTKEQLEVNTVDHIHHVTQALKFFTKQLQTATKVHDLDKLSNSAEFHRALTEGFHVNTWWARHLEDSRHHLHDAPPDNVDLLDVLEMIADCVVAGTARSGKVYPVKIPIDVLARAFDNTVALLTSQVELVEPFCDPDCG